MVIKLLTLAMVLLLVSCGGPGGSDKNGGSNGSGSDSGSGGAKSDSAELVELKKVLEDDYEIFILFNVSSKTFEDYKTHRLNGKIAIKSVQSFTSSDINCKSFNFSKISSGTNAGVKESTYKTKIESESSECKEEDFSEVSEKGDKNYIIMGKKR